LLGLSSCRKDEVFAPDRYVETESRQNGSYMTLSKRFDYSGKQLTSVFLAVGQNTLTFEYNKDKTVKKIMSSDKSSRYAELFYDDKRINRICYYDDGKLARESLFSRKEKTNTINKVESYVYDGFASESILAGLLFSETEFMPEEMRKAHKSGEKSLYAVQNITYEKDNISRVRLSYAENNEIRLHATITYTYDDKKNPYYGLPYALFQLTGYSKNNVTKAILSFENDKAKTMISLNNHYTYEKKYPVYCSTEKNTTYIVAIVDGKPQWTTDITHSAIEYTYKK
jgi:hypothetical protein